jgi:hypothetical protein
MMAVFTRRKMETISFNGKTYNSIEEMPADQRAIYEQLMAFMKDENNNGIPDMFEGDVIQKMVGMANTRVVVNGQEMQAVDSLPPEARAKFEKAMMKLSQIGFFPQGMQGLPSQPPAQPTPQIVQSEPAFTQSLSSFARPSPSAISDDTSPRAGLIIVVAVLAILLLCALAAVGFLLLNR